MCVIYHTYIARIFFKNGVVKPPHQTAGYIHSAATKKLGVGKSNPFIDRPGEFFYLRYWKWTAHIQLRRIDTIIITATRRACRGVHSDSLNKALFGPLAQQAPAGFLFSGDLIVEIDFQKSGGLVPAIIQDERNGEVLMLGFMNAESLEETRRTGEGVFFSRSRTQRWKTRESRG